MLFRSPGSLVCISEYIREPARGPDLKGLSGKATAPCKYLLGSHLEAGVHDIVEVTQAPN